MAAPAATLELMLAEMRDELRALRREVAELRRPAERRLVSKRRAAQMLGVNRDETLEGLIDAGRLQPVRIGKRDRIPVGQIEKLLETGEPMPSGPIPKRRARPAAVAPPPVDIAEQVRRLKIR